SVAACFRPAEALLGRAPTTAVGLDDGGCAGRGEPDEFWGRARRACEPARWLPGSSRWPGWPLTCRNPSRGCWGRRLVAAAAAAAAAANTARADFLRAAAVEAKKTPNVLCSIVGPAPAVAFNAGHGVLDELIVRLLKRRTPDVQTAEPRAALHALHDCAAIDRVQSHLAEAVRAAFRRGPKVLRTGFTLRDFVHESSVSSVGACVHHAGVLVELRTSTSRTPVGSHDSMRVGAFDPSIRQGKNSTTYRLVSSWASQFSCDGVWQKAVAVPGAQLHARPGVRLPALLIDASEAEVGGGSLALAADVGDGVRKRIAHRITASSISFRSCIRCVMGRFGRERLLITLYSGSPSRSIGTRFSCRYFIQSASFGLGPRIGPPNERIIILRTLFVYLSMSSFVTFLSVMESDLKKSNFSKIPPASTEVITCVPKSLTIRSDRYRASFVRLFTSALTMSVKRLGGILARWSITAGAVVREKQGLTIALIRFLAARAASFRILIMARVDLGSSAPEPASELAAHSSDDSSSAAAVATSASDQISGRAADSNCAEDSSDDAQGHPRCLALIGFSRRLQRLEFGVFKWRAPDRKSARIWSGLDALQDRAAIDSLRVIFVIFVSDSFASESYRLSAGLGQRVTFAAGEKSAKWNAVLARQVQVQTEAQENVPAYLNASKVDVDSTHSWPSLQWKINQQRLVFFWQRLFFLASDFEQWHLECDREKYSVIAEAQQNTYRFVLRRTVELASNWVLHRTGVGVVGAQIELGIRVVVVAHLVDASEAVVLGLVLAVSGKIGQRIEAAGSGVHAAYDGIQQLQRIDSGKVGLANDIAQRLAIAINRYQILIQSPQPIGELRELLFATESDWKKSTFCRIPPASTEVTTSALYLARLVRFFASAPATAFKRTISDSDSLKSGCMLAENKESVATEPSAMLQGIAAVALAAAIVCAAQATPPSVTEVKNHQANENNLPACKWLVDKKSNLNRFSALPGGGWDNLRNKDMGKVADISFNDCTLSDDGAYVLPNRVNLLIRKESAVEVMSEVMEHFNNYTSTLSQSINAEASNKVLSINGKLSDEFQQMKSVAVSSKFKMGRTQLRYRLYTAKLQPDFRLSEAFVSRMSDIVSAIASNRTKLARYLSDLVIRDFGTHVVTTVDAGGVLEKVDFFNKDAFSSQEFTNSKLSATMSLNFFSLLNMSAKFEYIATKQNVEKYEKSISKMSIKSHGGPVLGADPSLEDWLKGLKENLVGVDVDGEPLYAVISRRSLPEMPAVFLLQLRKEIEDAVTRYYAANAVKGCQDPNSANFDPTANLDGHCEAPATNFSFAGVYQTCTETRSWLGACSAYGGALRNPISGTFSCPKGYEEVPLLTKTGQTKEKCTKKTTNCYIFFTCDDGYDCEKSTTTLNTFWCAARKGARLRTHSGMVFGGAYATNGRFLNQVTQAASCRELFKPYVIGRDIALCLSMDLHSAARYRLPIGGFFSVGRETRWPSQVGVTLDTVDGCAVMQCVKGRSGLHRLPVRRPPFEEPDDELIERPVTRIEKHGWRWGYDISSNSWSFKGFFGSGVQKATGLQASEFRVPSESTDTRISTPILVVFCCCLAGIMAGVAITMLATRSSGSAATPIMQRLRHRFKRTRRSSFDLPDDEICRSPLSRSPELNHPRRVVYGTVESAEELLDCSGQSDKDKLAMDNEAEVLVSTSHGAAGGRSKQPVSQPVVGGGHHAPGQHCPEAVGRRAAHKPGQSAPPPTRACICDLATLSGYTRVDTKPPMQAPWTKPQTLLLLVEESAAGGSQCRVCSRRPKYRAVLVVLRSRTWWLISRQSETHSAEPTIQFRYTIAFSKLAEGMERIPIQISGAAMSAASQAPATEAAITALATAASLATVGNKRLLSRSHLLLLPVLLLVVLGFELQLNQQREMIGRYVRMRTAKNGGLLEPGLRHHVKAANIIKVPLSEEDIVNAALELVGIVRVGHADVVLIAAGQVEVLLQVVRLMLGPMRRQSVENSLVAQLFEVQNSGSQWMCAVDTTICLGGPPLISSRTSKMAITAMLSLSITRFIISWLSSLNGHARKLDNVLLDEGESLLLPEYGNAVNVATLAGRHGLGSALGTEYSIVAVFGQFGFEEHRELFSFHFLQADDVGLTDCGGSASCGWAEAAVASTGLR
uniref:Macrophage-expressed gene 1 protein n=1 Tax=Macrostomum lignano TaxID=282301 RepID=A0A1I8J0I3_9PLAT